MLKYLPSEIRYAETAQCREVPRISTPSEKRYERKYTKKSVIENIPVSELGCFFARILTFFRALVLKFDSLNELGQGARAPWGMTRNVRSIGGTNGELIVHGPNCPMFHCLAWEPPDRCLPADNRAESCHARRTTAAFFLATRRCFHPDLCSRRLKSRTWQDDHTGHCPN